MIGDIRKHLAASPFVPFSVCTTDGFEYPVKTLDNVFVPKDDDRIVITYGMANMVVLPAERIKEIRYHHLPGSNPAA